MNTFIFIVLIIILVCGVFYYQSKKEGICINSKFGRVSDVPFSSYVNANTALVSSDTLGSAPFGSPLYWKGTSSPVLGMYGYTDAEYNLLENYFPKYTENPFNN